MLLGFIPSLPHLIRLSPNVPVGTGPAPVLLVRGGQLGDDRVLREAAPGGVRGLPEAGERQYHRHR